MGISKDSDKQFFPMTLGRLRWRIRSFYHKYRAVVRRSWRDSFASAPCGGSNPSKGKTKKRPFSRLYAELERFACILFSSRGIGKQNRGIARCAHRTMNTPPACSITHSNLSTGKKKEPASGRLFLFGGVGEIRTLEELLTPTRFPIVRARPTTRQLRIARNKSVNLSALPL